MAWRYVGGKEPVGVKILRVDDDGRIGYENIEKAKAKEKKKKSLDADCIVMYWGRLILASH